jgi:hypothetical protein
MERKEILVNLVSFIFTLGIVLMFMSLNSCSVYRETGKRIYDVEFQSPVKVRTLNKCNERN